MVVYGSIPGNFHKIIGFCHFFFGMSIRTGESRQVPTLPLATPRLTLSMSISASKSLSARGDEPCRWKGCILTRRKCKRSPQKSLSPTHGDVFSFFVGQFFPRTWWHINIVFFLIRISTSLSSLPTNLHKRCYLRTMSSMDFKNINKPRQIGFTNFWTARFLRDPVVLRIVIQRASQLEGLVNWGKGKADSHSFVFASLIKHSPKSFPSTKNHIRNW